MPYDLHTHSLASDGTESPAEVARGAAAAGLDGFALTDHDTFDGLPAARAAAAEVGIAFLGGLEFSTQLRGAPIHLLGYGCRPDDAALAAELARVRSGRAGRTPQLLARLGALGLPLTEAEVAAFAADASAVGRPHVADAMVAKGYVRDRDEAFAKWLSDDGPAFVGRYATPLQTAVALVRAAGGVAVVAHPWSRRGRHALPVRVLRELRAAGLDGWESDHPDHTPSERAQLRALADELGAVCTGSSDYHGAGKTKSFGLGACTTDAATWHRLGEEVARRGGVPD